MSGIDSKTFAILAIVIAVAALGYGIITPGPEGPQGLQGIPGEARARRGHPLGIRDKLRNRRINRKRAPGERPFAVIKRVFHAGHVLVTTVKRVHVKMVFACLCYDLVQLNTLGGG